MLKKLGLSFYFFQKFVHSSAHPEVGGDGSAGEEYIPKEVEVLAIVLENQPAPVGVSLFRSNREVENYWARFPDCCSRHTSQKDVPIRSLVTAVAAWAEKWILDSCVKSQHPVSGRGRGQERWHQAFRPLKVG